MAVGRFQVMATLQAARANELGLSKDEAFSWGLNRAIFYAAAKRGFRGGSPESRKFRGGGEEKQQNPSKDIYKLGDEMAFKEEEKEGKLRFKFGGETQTDKDFERQIESRFRGTFDVAWREALDIMKSYDRDTLLSQREFYESVYKPRRDVLAKKWSDLAAGQDEPAKAEPSRETTRKKKFQLEAARVRLWPRS